MKTSTRGYSEESFDVRLQSGTLLRARPKSATS